MTTAALRTLTGVMGGIERRWLFKMFQLNCSSSHTKNYSFIFRRRTSCRSLIGRIRGDDIRPLPAEGCQRPAALKIAGACTGRDVF
jgi:hypothetical protein